MDTLLNVTTFKFGQGLSILVCVDVSGSMKGKPLDSVKNALLSFIGKKRANDEIAILAFSEKEELVCDFSTDTEFLRESIGKLKILPGDTSLYYCIDKGLDRLGGPTARNEGRFMILFSDGKEDNPATAYTIDGVIEKARAKQIPIFTAGYTRQEKQYLQILDRISQQTGGSFYDAPDAQSLSDHFGKVSRQILGSYVLTYPVFGLAGDGLEKDLSLTLTQGTYKAEFPEPVKVRVPANREAISGPEEIDAKGGGKLSLGWIIGIIAVLLAAAAGIFFWLKDKSRNAWLNSAASRKRKSASAGNNRPATKRNSAGWRNKPGAKPKSGPRTKLPAPVSTRLFSVPARAPANHAANRASAWK